MNGENFYIYFNYLFLIKFKFKYFKYVKLLRKVINYILVINYI